jgi:hypothetical protein
MNNTIQALRYILVEVIWPVILFLLLIAAIIGLGILSQLLPGWNPMGLVIAFGVGWLGGSLYTYIKR